MNKFLKVVGLMLVGIMVFGAVAFAQTTYFVNAQTGLDGYNGLSATVTGTPGVGPKATINNAIAAASAGDIIVVDFGNGTTYNENVTVNKRLTFGVSANSGSGTPTVTSWTVNITGVSNTCTFTGPFRFNTGLTLSSGAVIGAGNLTVGGTITRTALSATTSSTVDAQLFYTGTVNFVYTGGFAITTGLEMPPSLNTTTMGAITTATAGTNLTLSESKTMNGALTTVGTLNLGGGTLTLVNTAAATHTVAGNVSNGTMAFSLGAAATVNGNFFLPAVTATASTTARILTLNTNVAPGAGTPTTTISGLTASGTAAIYVPSAPVVGSVTSSGTGIAAIDGGATNAVIHLAAATTVGAVSNSATGANGNVVLTVATTIASITNSGSGFVSQGAAGALSITGNVLQTGAGSIAFASTGGVTIAGTLTNSPAISFTGGSGNLAQANLGFISFADGAVSVTGVVTNSPSFAGTTSTGSTGRTTSWTNSGQIRFTTTASNLTFTGGIVVGATSALANGGVSGTGASTITGNGAIIFATTGGNILGGGITNSSSWPNLTAVTAQGAFTQTDNGSIIITTRTTGTIGTSVSAFGPIVNSATATNASTNGDINLGPGGGFFGTSVSSSGGAGGFIIFGNESVTLSSSVTNSRTSAPTSPAGHIQFGSAATVGVAFSIGGDINNSGASRIVFNSYDNAAAEAFQVAGNLISSGTGAIWIRNAPMTGTGVMAFGGINLTAGTIDLSGGGAATATLTVNGTTNFAGGTLTLTTSATRTLRLGGLTNSFSTATTSTVFTSTVNVTLLIQASTIFGQQIVNGNATPTVWYGHLNVNNTNNNAITPGVIFQGGNFRILRNVTFAGSIVNLNNLTLFIGGQAPAFAGQGGNFINTIGYTTTGTSFVSMNHSTGSGAQTLSGAGSFGNFELDCGASDVTVVAATGKFTGTFNLTSGTVVNSANVVFDNATNPPTIVRNAGTFDAIPTFTSKVNVYYIGLDKGTSNELPLLADRLQDLTVATTNSPSGTPGRGTVNVGVATTVNGTLNVFAGQALLIDGVNLTVKGAAVTLGGDITNDVAGIGRLVFGATTGTTVTGAGALPDITVDAGSVGNVISGSVGLATGLLGVNAVRGIADDVNPGTLGTITFTANTGTGTSSLTVSFGTPNVTTNTHFAGALTTATGGTFTLGANLIHTGNIVHAAGVIDVGTFTFLNRGTAPVFTGGALTIGTGTLAFDRTGLASVNTLFQAVTSDVTIAANVTINNFATADLFQIDPVTAGHLIISGNLTLTRGTMQLGDVATTRNLTLTGSTFTVGSAGAINTTGIGTLRLNATTAPMTVSFATAPTLGNVRISNGVTLAGAGTSLTVSGTLTHDGGVLDFNTRTLTASGTYVRSAGTYAATTGYFVFSGTAFNQGATDVTIPNLRLSNTGNVSAAGAGVVTVSTALDVRVTAGFTFTHTVLTAAKLAVASGATVNYRSGALDVAPTYAGTIILVADQVASGSSVSATVWPSTPTTLVTTFRVSSVAAANTVQIPGSRTVNTTLDLRTGVLDLSTGNTASRTLTLADNATVRRRHGGSVTLDLAASGANAGTITFGANTSVIYESGAGAADGNILTGPELPAAVKDLTFTRSANVANAMTEMTTAVTVSGILTIRNNVGSTEAGVISTLGDVVVALDAAWTNATAPAFALTAPIQFTGAAAQTITVPSTGAAIGAITINKTGTTPVPTVTLAGGNLTVTGTVTFVNGLFATGTNVLILNAPPAPAQGFVRTGVTGSNLSHVVGNVRKTLSNTGNIITSTSERSEFPVGTSTLYRPAAFTFKPNFGIPTIPNGLAITVNHVSTKPTGTVGLPIVDGVTTGVSVARYADFYWNISSNVSIGNTKFDLELTAVAYSDFDAIGNVRIIRRLGTATDVANAWSLQGNPVEYDNFVAGGIPTVVNVNSIGGIRPEGGIFTYGLKSTLFVQNPIGTITLPDGARTFTKSLVTPPLFGGTRGTVEYSVVSANTAIATASIAANVLTVRGMVPGSTTITVSAIDSEVGQIGHSFTANVTGVTDVEVVEAIPTEFALSQNYPNPFNPSTTIKFALPSAAPVTLEIYNTLGVKVRTLIAGDMMAAKFHQITWNGMDESGSVVPSGMYLYRLVAGDFKASKKMMMLK